MNPHPKDNNGNYCMPGRVPDYLLEENEKEKTKKALENRTSEKELRQKVEKINKQKEEKYKQQNTIKKNVNINILKSNTLKHEKNLNLIVQDSFLPLQMNTKTIEMLKIQEALIKIGFNLIKATGDFDNKTKTALETFQNKYKPTHNTHKNYTIFRTIGIVDKNITLALDEAVIEKYNINKEAEQKCKIKIDFTFIEKQEGQNELNGYTLVSEESKSGVTIATGFDLGARDENDLKRLNLNTELINKLKPYLKYKEQMATNYLKDNPLSITLNESIEINEAVKEQITNNLIKKYDAESKIKFICTPADAQTVIYSVEFQYGSAKIKTHDFWKQAINQEWKNMYNNLMNFHDKYSSRRKSEAKLIKRLL